LGCGEDTLDVLTEETQRDGGGEEPSRNPVKPWDSTRLRNWVFHRRKLVKVSLMVTKLVTESVMG
jgi:hypothetical protein